MSLYSHVYEREVVQGSGDSLDHVAGLIVEPGPVLDVGTGSGALGRFLRAAGRTDVDGITHNPDEAVHASSAYRQLSVLDLTRQGWSAALLAASYRYIVCADVLEHLADPAAALRELLPLLADDGELIVSVPNVAYLGLVAELLNGEFRYRQEGLLDQTHLRFFTRKTLQRFLAAHGLSVSAWRSVSRPVLQSEFARNVLDGMPPAMVRYLCAQPDAHTYQLVLRAGRQAAGQTLPETVPAWNSPVFAAQVFWAGQDGVFDERDSALALGTIGDANQTLRFPVRLVGGVLQQLRIDPADRPGFLRMRSVRLRSADGEVIWQRALTVADFQRAAEMIACPVNEHDPGVQLAVCGDDPHFFLDVGTALAADQQLMLELDIGWPYQPEAANLGMMLFDVREQLRVAEGASAALDVALQACCVRLDEECAVSASARESLAEAESRAANLALRANNLERQLLDLDQTLNAQLTELSLQNADLRDRLARSESMLSAVRGSKLWRLGRKLKLSRIDL